MSIICDFMPLGTRFPMEVFVSLNDTVESYSGHVIRIVFYARLNGD
jgi:hypothetical protein